MMNQHNAFDEEQYTRTLVRRRRYIVRNLRDVQAMLFRERLRALRAISDEQWAEALQADSSQLIADGQQQVVNG